MVGNIVEYNFTTCNYFLKQILPIDKKNSIKSGDSIWSFFFFFNNRSFN